MINNVILPHSFGSFLGYSAAKTTFPTEVTTLRESAQSAIHKLIKISLTSVVRSSGKVGGLPKRRRGNKTGDLSVDVIDLLKNV